MKTALFVLIVTMAALVGRAQTPTTPEPPTLEQQLQQARIENLRLQSALAEAHACFESLPCLQIKFGIANAAKSIMETPPPAPANQTPAGATNQTPAAPAVAKPPQ